MTNILAEDNSLVVREGTLDRLRVPAGILAAAGASYDSGDGIHWQVQDFGPQGTLVVGTVVKDARHNEAFARKPPTPPARVATPAGTTPAPAKKSGKKGSKKSAAVAPLPGGVVAVAPANFASQFATVPVAVAPTPTVEDDEYDDGPLPAEPAPTLFAATPPAAPIVAAAPVPKGKKGGAAKKGAVAYQVPGQPAGLGSQFS